MQRKSTPLSHPFHVLSAVFVLIIGSIPLASWGSPVFHIECPPDVTIGCEGDLSDLSAYGNAVVYGYGNPQSAGPPVSVDYELGNCNTGTIVRTWVAYDYTGQAYYCSQTIVVQGNDGDIDIYWPPDYIIHSCSPATEPEDLPPPYDRPVIYGDQGPCSQILFSHHDLVFNINPPACRKIVRKWTAIDWCTYDPNAYYPIGIWEYTQVIKIAPENPPVIQCPGDVTVSAGADCYAGHVTLPIATGSSDCDGNVIITNNSPYAFHHGPDASGDYPVGTTKVTFYADDGCGHKTSCHTYVTVQDLKKPTPICFYGVSIALMQMPDGYYMNLRPSFFDKGSVDNCTPKSKLKMWVDPPSVGCEELGAVPVRLYVEDESGNVEYCNTLVYVQDNMAMCPPMTGEIDGNVHGPAGAMLEEVNVALQESTTFSMTNETGHYAFPSVHFGKPYTIMPSDPHDDLEGVSAIDMVVLLKHILGVERFTSPYQSIAADLDRSGRVSVTDLLLLKELILKDYYGLEPETSWRFVLAAYVFENDSDPLSEDFPESYHIPVFTESMTDLDFVGIKLGDMNGDAASDLNRDQVVTSRNPGVSMYIGDRSFERGETFEVQVILDPYETIEAMQFAIDVNTELLDIVSVKTVSATQGLDVLNRSADYGVISGLWYGLEPLASSHLCTFKVYARESGSLSHALTLTQSPASVAYTHGSDVAKPVELQYDSAPIIGEQRQNGIKIGQNYPNPFNGQTYIPLQLKETGPITVELFDMHGRILQHWIQDGIQGLQEIIIDARDVGIKGMILCRITSGSESATIRILIEQGP